MTRESLLVDSANRNNQDLLLMVLTGAYGSYTKEEVDNGLIRAAINGNAGCVSLLLDWNADCDAEDMDGDTPLMLAACNNHVSVVQQLLRAGCSVNATSDRRRTALHMAAWVGNVSICKILLQAGADPNIKEMYGDTALMLAAHRSPEVASILAKYDRAINLKNESGDTALSCAAKSGHCQTVEDLVKAGADVNSKNRHGETAVLYAAYENHVNIAKFLLEHGADPNIASQSGLVPLHIACKQKLQEMCKVLLDGNADPNVADKIGQRPLTFAVGSGNVNIVAKLIKAGACPKYHGPSLFQRQTVVVSPLYKALLERKLDIAKVLHRAGSCSQSELYQIYTCEDLQSELEDTARGNEVLLFLKEIASSPTTLRLKCLHAVQSLVGREKGWQEKAKSLHLPKPLIDFLLFQDLDT